MEGRKIYRLNLDVEAMERIRMLSRLKCSSMTAIVNDLIIGFLDRNTSAIKDLENAARKADEKIVW